MVVNEMCIKYIYMCIIAVVVGFVAQMMHAIWLHVPCNPCNNYAHDTLRLWLWNISVCPICLIAIVSNRSPAILLHHQLHHNPATPCHRYCHADGYIMPPLPPTQTPPPSPSAS
uniref:Uncharacterized protein n=1 Tax=Anopheles darlingi TaxID=43151 RepID=A0A2M4DPE5_ANODA